MKSYPYYICDVFTDKRFGGNQLAVLPDAQGLTLNIISVVDGKDKERKCT